MIDNPSQSIGVCVAILAGGRSRRMGRDKAELCFPSNDETVLERTARLAQTALAALPCGAAAKVFVVGRTRPDHWPLDLAQVEFVPDRFPDSGPLGGLATALAAATVQRAAKVLLLACDLPRLNRDALLWLLENNATGDNYGVITQREGEWEPLFSIYSVALLPIIEARLNAGHGSMRGLITAADLRVLALPSSLAPALFNLNTPADWQQLHADWPADSSSEADATRVPDAID